MNDTMVMPSRSTTKRSTWDDEMSDVRDAYGLRMRKDLVEFVRYCEICNLFLS